MLAGVAMLVFVAQCTRECHSRGCCTPPCCSAPQCWNTSRCAASRCQRRPMVQVIFLLIALPVFVVIECCIIALPIGFLTLALLIVVALGVLLGVAMARQTLPGDRGDIQEVREEAHEPDILFIGHTEMKAVAGYHW